MQPAAGYFNARDTSIVSGSVDTMDGATWTSSAMQRSGTQVAAIRLTNCRVKGINPDVNLVTATGITSFVLNNTAIDPANNPTLTAYGPTILNQGVYQPNILLAMPVLRASSF
jgi:hypothetical protein